MVYQNINFFTDDDGVCLLAARSVWGCSDRYAVRRVSTAVCKGVDVGLVKI